MQSWVDVLGLEALSVQGLPDQSPDLKMLCTRKHKLHNSRDRQAVANPRHYGQAGPDTLNRTPCRSGARQLPLSWRAAHFRVKLLL